MPQAESQERIWGCQYTRRDGLTFHEAASSEATARELIKLVSPASITVLAPLPA